MPKIEIQGEVTIRWGRSRRHEGMYFLTVQSGERNCRYIGTVDAVMALAAPAFNRIPWAEGEFVLPEPVRPESVNEVSSRCDAPVPCRAK